MEEVERSTPKLKLFGATIPIESTQIKKERDSKEDEETKREKTDQDNKEGSTKVLPCPRCKSTDTKFCYFNNYNVNQPRHFCKGCQRYWTAGGTLRNVPFGAGRRKAKPAVSGGSSEEIGGSCLFHAADAREFGVEGMVVGQWANVSILSPPAKRRQTFLYGQTR